MDHSTLNPPISTRRPAVRWRQRRGEPRRPCHAELEVVSPIVGTGVTLNISDHGMRIAVDCELEAQGQYLIRVGDGDAGYECVRVVWLREARDGWIAGLERLGMH